MSLEEQLKNVAEGLREEGVPNFFVQDLYMIADEVGDLEWRMNDLED